MNSYTKVSKDALICGTCTYWSGEQIIYRNSIQYELNSSAICTNCQSPSYGHTVDSENYCFNRKDIDT